MSEKIGHINFKKIALFTIIVLTLIALPLIIISILNKGGISIYITLIVLVSLIVVFLFIYIIFDLIRLMKNRQKNNEN